MELTYAVMLLMLFRRAPRVFWQSVGSAHLFSYLYFSVAVLYGNALSASSAARHGHFDASVLLEQLGTRRTLRHFEAYHRQLFAVMRCERLARADVRDGKVRSPACGVAAPDGRRCATHRPSGGRRWRSASA